MVLGALAKRGHVAYGADVSREGFDGRARAAGARLVLTDASTLGVRSETTDLVYSFAAFEHFADPHGVVDEAWRVLRPGGHLYLMFGPVYTSPYGLHAYRQIPVPYCQYLFTEADLKTYATSEGLPTAWPYVNGVSVTLTAGSGQSRRRASSSCTTASIRPERRRGADHQVSLLLPVEGADVRRPVRIGRRDLSSQAMRILALENELTSMRGGQEISLLDVCRGPGREGPSDHACLRDAGDLEDEYRRICHRMVRVRTYSIDRSRTPLSLRDFLVSLWAVRGERPDVVYANQYQDSLFAAIARRLRRTPFVCHLRLPPPDVMCTHSGSA
jgi:hypothetical protein